MARPKQFDPDEALDAAMKLFWEQGYEGTSVQELVERTGVHKRSMYDTFGDKHALFVKALSRYAGNTERQIRAAAKATGSATDAIRALLETALPDAAAGLPPGCLLVNSATELAARDPDAAGPVAQHFATSRRAMRDLVARGQREGEIATRLKPAPLAELLLNAWLGLRVQSRAGTPPAQLRAGVDAALAVLAP
jgi:TetR/AcrR family transcriptional repressor of nem operon